MTTSQHLDKAAPPRRWPRFLRRASPPPGADDGRALLAANRRIVHLEMQNAVLQRRIDRAAGQCTPPCWHAQHLEAAQVENLRLRAEQDDVYARLRDVLDKLRAANDAGPAAGPELPR